MSANAAQLREHPTSRLPRLAWPGWAERAAPVVAYCRALRGRSWPELHAWARGRMAADELVNALAWAEEHGCVQSIGTGEQLRWVATG